MSYQLVQPVRSLRGLGQARVIGVWDRNGVPLDAHLWARRVMAIHGFGGEAFGGCGWNPFCYAEQVVDIAVAPFKATADLLGGRNALETAGDFFNTNVAPIVGGAEDVASIAIHVGKGAAKVAVAAKSTVELVVDAAEKATVGAIRHTVNFMGAVLSGQNVQQAAANEWQGIRADVTEIGHVAQMVLPYIPGIGTVASMAIGAGLALANGQSITNVALAGLRGALPGAPISYAAWDAGVTIANGGTLTDGALAGVRSQLPDNPYVRETFDATVAIAHGKNIQDTLGDLGTHCVTRAATSPELQDGAASVIGGIASHSGGDPDSVGAGLDPFIQSAYEAGRSAANQTIDTVKQFRQGAIGQIVAASGAVPPEVLEMLDSPDPMATAARLVYPGMTQAAKDLLNKLAKDQAQALATRAASSATRASQAFDLGVAAQRAHDTARGSGILGVDLRITNDASVTPPDVSVILGTMTSAVIAKRRRDETILVAVAGAGIVALVAILA